VVQNPEAQGYVECTHGISRHILNAELPKLDFREFLCQRRLYEIRLFDVAIYDVETKDMLRAGPRRFNRQTSVVAGTIQNREPVKGTSARLQKIWPSVVFQSGHAILVAHTGRIFRHSVEPVGKFNGMVKWSEISDPVADLLLR
jgi:hypothetical protein